MCIMCVCVRIVCVLVFLLVFQWCQRDQQCVCVKCARVKCARVYSVCGVGVISSVCMVRVYSVRV